MIHLRQFVACTLCATQSSLPPTLLEQLGLYPPHCISCFPVPPLPSSAGHLRSRPGGSNRPFLPLHCLHGPFFAAAQPLIVCLSPTSAGSLWWPLQGKQDTLLLAPSSALHSYQPLLHSSPALSPLLSPRSAGSLWWPLLGAQDTFLLAPSSALHSYQPTSPSVPSCPLCHREFVVATPGGRQKLDKISFQRRPESCSNSR